MISQVFDNIYVLSLLKKVNTILFGMLAVIFLNRALGPTLKGEYISVLNLITTLTNVLYLGVSTVYPNYIRKQEKWTFSTFVGLIFAQGAVYLSIAVCVGVIFHSRTYLLYGITIASAVVSMQLLQISIINDFRKGTIANIISVAVNALCMFIMWCRGIRSVEIAILILLIKELSIVACSFSILKKSFSWSDMDARRWKGIVLTGIIPMITNLMVVLNYKADVILLQGFQIDYYQIGLYSTGLALAEYGWIISDIFKDVLIKKTSSADNINAVTFCLRISSTVLIAIGAVLWCGSKLILSFLYGAEYREAGLITNIMVFGVFSMSHCKLLIPLYLAKGRWKLYFFILSGAAGINIAANLLLIPSWGIYGAAITSIVSYSFAGLVFSIVFIKEYQVNIKDIVFIRRNDIHRFVETIKRIG